MTAMGAVEEMGRPRHVPEDLYGSWCPSLSPDGRAVAFVSDRSGRPEVWIRPMAGGPSVPVPLDSRRVTAVSWAPTGAWLAAVVAPPGASRTEVWVVRPDGSDARRVAGGEPATAVLAEGRSRGWTAAGHLVVTELDRSCRVLRVDPAGGEPVALAGGDLTVAVDVTPDGQRLLLRRGPRGARELVVFDVGGSAPGPPVVPRTFGGSTDGGCLSPDGDHVLVRTDADREAAELATVPVGSCTPGTGTPIFVVRRSDGELEEVALSADGTIAALVWNVAGGVSALTLLETATGRQYEVASLPRPVLHGCQLSADGARLVLTAEGPADPQGVWALDVAAAIAAGPRCDVPLVPISSPGRGALHASKGASTETVDPSQVVTPDLVELRSEDGTPVTGWWYHPDGPGPFPTMMWLHGGPEAQERPVYNSLFQSLLAEGVAVFAPNVRGSTGHGRAFRNADDGAGRYGAFADVAACASHLTGTGMTPPGRLGLSGRSYGGYLTLAALVHYPELFAVGVDVSGMSDLHTFYAHTEPWIAAAAVAKYGDPVRDRALLRDLSPLHDIERLRAPLLIVHGADDTNVPFLEAEQLAAALTERGLPHRLLVFPEEGHELLATPARVAFVHAVVDWVVRYLASPPLLHGAQSNS